MCNVIRCSLLWGSALGTLLVCIVSHASLLAGDDDGKKEEEARREQQLKNMKRSAAQYAISTADDRKRLFKFHENAAMRWNNPAGAAKDGAVFIWSDRGRPQAIMKLYTFDNERFFHEWQSLSESAIFLERDGKTVWNPTEPGIKFRELPDAPKVAESAAERLRQMKALAGKFSSIYTQIPGESKPDELRLLIQPLFRFEASDDKQHLDGVIFGFARATDPIGLLIFEARRSGETYKWNYAFARMATGALTAKYGDKEIFSVDSYYANRGPKQTFLILNRQPIPKE